MLKGKTKIVIASVVGAIIVIPIILFIVVLLWITIGEPSVETTGLSSVNSRALSAGSYGGTTAMAPSSDQASVSEESASEFYDITTSGSTAAEVDQKIIKTGYLELVIDSADEAAAKISALTTSKGGYTQDSSISEDPDGTRYGTMTVRVPADEFENTMTEIKKMAVTVSTESVSGQDVTEEYTDLEAQLKNAQAQEAEYLVILKKAESVEDILSVQSYLGEIRGQIETLQGRIKYLSNLTSYSTITVYLSEDPTISIPSKEFRPWSAIKEAAQAVVSILQGLVITAIWLVILGGGVLIPVAAIIWLGIRVVKKIRHHRRSKK